ncbi:CDP-glycerol glycerophosphotransferase family protein [Mesobacillus jeotgali]|uniref:CDP-glycerol glycerophosphotransferase family protein n=1 Tax=Mesobacillus jeotgali TaxID=129985 RepID=UPI0013151AF8|nr:CDP-glycerol glycerophosphotransferase family protein [Mesobacillus jeotgali]
MKDKVKTAYIRALLITLKCLYKLVKKKPGRICVIDETPNSGSNAEAIYKYIAEEVKYNDVFITKKYMGRGMTLRDMYMVASSHVYICTHKSFKVSKDRVCIQTWHGIPLKGMNYMDRGEEELKAETWHKEFNNCDIILSSSNLYEVLLSSCIGIQRNKFVKTGFPRNDFLTMNNKTSKADILGLFEDGTVNSDTKVIVYLPTFRLGHKKDKIEGKLREGNIFGFDNYNSKELEQNLKANNCVIIAKLHPIEEKLLSANKLATSSRIKLVNSKWLEESKNDLYNLLSVSDMLITDYSSVYFDYLLLDKPIIFINNDLDQYRQNRSLLLEPYDFWTPGYKVSNQYEFIHSLNNYINNHEVFAKERKQIKSMLIETEGHDNCKRVWKEVVEPIVIK